MQYKLVGQNNYLMNPIETVLKNRGVEDIYNFLNVTKDMEHDFKLLDNIEKGVDLIFDHLRMDSKIYLQIDTDVDGVTSSVLFYNYIKFIKPNARIQYDIHTNKIHGINSCDVENDVDLVVVIDAGTNDVEEHRKLSSRNKDILIIDHHEVDEDVGLHNILATENLVLVNNQACDYPNKALSGVGVMYKLAQAMDAKLGINKADDYLDLVAMGLVGDLMDTRSLETRYYIMQGIKKITNPLIKAIIKKNDYQIKGHVNIKTIGWNISPFINAVIRFGTQEEKLDMFEAMTEDSEKTIPYKKRGSDFTVHQPLPEAMARISGNIRGKQNRVRDKSVKVIMEMIEEENLDSNKVMIVDVTDKLDKSLTGLVAGQLANVYKRPTLLIRLNKCGKYTGSGRNYNNSPLDDFKELINGTNCFEFARGHASAFGIEILPENLELAKDMLEKHLSDMVFDKKFDVDFIIPYSNLKTSVIKELAEHADIWGKEVSEPFICVEDININVETDILVMGKSENTIKFEVKDIEFIMFKAEDIIEDLRENYAGENISITVVGTCDINEYNGKKTYQVKVQDCNYEKTNKIRF